MGFPLEDNRGICPNCHQASGFKLEFSHPVWPHSSSYYPNWVTGERCGISAFKCLYCGCTSTFLDTYTITTSEASDPAQESGSETMISRKLIAPNIAPRELSEHAPQQVRDAYREASVCEQAGAMVAAGIMYRAAIEALVKHEGAKGRDLYKKIETLRGDLGSEIVDEALHEVRQAGNSSAHEGVAHTDIEVADIAELVQSVVFVVYEQPAQRMAMRESRRERQAAAKGGARGAGKMPDDTVGAV